AVSQNQSQSGSGGNPAEDTAVPVEVSELKARDLYRSVFYGCRLQPAARFVHRSPLTGSLESIAVRTGQRVRQGDILFTVRRELAGRSYNSVPVRASSGGVVADYDLRPGDPVQENQALLTVLDDGAFTGEILVSDKDIGTVRIGDSCVVFEDRKPTNTIGQVTLISPEPEYETGLFPVELRFSRSPGLFIGKFIRVELRKEPYHGLAVPSENIVRKYGEDHLYIVSDDVVELRPVTVGASYGDLVTITDGVSGGELFVTSSTRRISDGAAVTIVEGE
ncbi:MAG: efflux RND transporter periplasmic adaptor subunit, partial [Sediminispirochaetaceae bacterium]